jgi:hypothetical protein
MQITTHPAPSNTKIRILSTTPFRTRILLFAFALKKMFSVFFKRRAAREGSPE